MRVPVPDLETQKAIANFLDRETARIDQLIEKKERLISVLSEKRRATIRQVVTLGTAPTVEKRASRINEGEPIPAHWSEQRLSTFCRFVQGKAHEPFFDETGDFVCVTARFVSTQGQQRKLCSRNLTRARRGDIAMVMSDLPNGRALARAFFIDANHIYAINQRVCVITIKRGNPKFFYYQLDRNIQLLRYDDGFNQTHLPNRAFTQLFLRVPPATEQDVIVEFLESRLSNIDQFTRLTSKSIDRLRELRAALITATVTGQIDVKTWGKSGKTDRRLDRIEQEMSSGEVRV